MLKHELMMKHEREVKALGEKHSKFVLETRDRYEKLLKDERVKFERKHAEDSKKLKHLMDRSLEEKQKDLVNVFKDQHGSDLDHIKQSFEDDKRRIIDELTKDHMVCHLLKLFGGKGSLDRDPFKLNVTSHAIVRDVKLNSTRLMLHIHTCS